MKVINLSKKKFSTLNLVEIGDGVRNTEAKLYFFDHRGRKMVFKNLHRLKGGIFANKLVTIEMLNDNKEYLPSNFVIPSFLGSVNGEVLGFAEDYIEGTNLQVYLNNIKIDCHDKIHHLKQIGNTLEQLKYIRRDTPLNNIYINDLHAGNFIVTPTNELKVIDLDSSKICDNKPFPSIYLSSDTIIKYSNKYKIYDKGDSNNQEYEYRKELGHIEADENSDIYCYIITIMNYLFGNSVHKMTTNEFYDYLNYLELIGINKELIDCFEKILLNCDNENPVEYLSSLTTKNITMANKKVYTKYLDRKLKLIN